MLFLLQKPKQTKTPDIWFLSLPSKRKYTGDPEDHDNVPAFIWDVPSGTRWQETKYSYKRAYLWRPPVTQKTLSPITSLFDSKGETRWG